LSSRDSAKCVFGHHIMGSAHLGRYYGCMRLLHPSSSVLQSRFAPKLYPQASDFDGLTLWHWGTLVLRILFRMTCGAIDVRECYKEIAI
jgi:hypothetical protein